MGLDMFAMAVPAAVAGNQQVDITAGSEGTQVIKLACWRKFNHLHGWMEKLYRAKGGTAKSFNCTTVRLDTADLAALEVAIGDPEKNLPPTKGFFFGNDQMYPEDITSTKTFITDARKAIVDGQAVLYDRWW